MRELENGKAFLEIPNVIDKEYNEMKEKVGTDKLMEEGSKLLKDVF